MWRQHLACLGDVSRVVLSYLSAQQKLFWDNGPSELRIHEMDADICMAMLDIDPLPTSTKPIIMERLCELGAIDYLRSIPLQEEAIVKFCFDWMKFALEVPSKCNVLDWIISLLTPDILLRHPGLLVKIRAGFFAFDYAGAMWCLKHGIDAKSILSAFEHDDVAHLQLYAHTWSSVNMIQFAMQYGSQKCLLWALTLVEEKQMKQSYFDLFLKNYKGEIGLEFLQEVIAMCEPTTCQFLGTRNFTYESAIYLHQHFGIALHTICNGNIRLAILLRQPSTDYVLNGIGMRELLVLKEISPESFAVDITYCYLDDLDCYLFCLAHGSTVKCFPFELPIYYRLSEEEQIRCLQRMPYHGNNLDGKTLHAYSYKEADFLLTKLPHSRTIQCQVGWYALQCGWFDLWRRTLYCWGQLTLLEYRPEEFQNPIQTVLEWTTAMKNREWFMKNVLQYHTIWAIPALHAIGRVNIDSSILESVFPKMKPEVQCIMYKIYPEINHEIVGFIKQLLM